MPLDLDRTLGVGVVEWIEANLVHGPGDVQGEPIRLDDEQVRLLLAVYAIDDAGRRLVNRAVYSRAKGRAKSELAAMVCCAEALGPVRFSHWMDPVGRSGPVGRPVTAPFIKVVATEEGQAGNTYGAIEFMLQHGPVASTPGLDVGRTRTFLPDGGEIRAVSAAAASKDGGKESHVNFDETHLYTNDGLRGVHQTLRRNLSKRKQAEPWSLETTTMYAPGENSVAELVHVYASKIAKGEITDPGLLFDHIEGPAVVDFNDDAQILASLRVAYGEAAGWMDFDRLLADANAARNDVDHRRLVGDFKRYFLNQPTRAEEAVWIPPTVWADLAAGDHPVLEDGLVGVGVEVDLSGSLAAVAVAWRVASTDRFERAAGDGGRVAVSCRVWSSRVKGETHERVDGEVVPTGLLDDFIVETLAGRSGVVSRDERFFPARDLEDRGVPLVNLQGQGQEMAAAAKVFHQAVHTGRLVHDGDPVVHGQVTTTRAVANDSGWRLVRAKAESWPVATVALVRALAALEAEVPSVYDQRDLLVV